MNEEALVTWFLSVRGPRACFRRPEFAVDLVSYDVMPPTVARQIVKATGGPGWKLRRIRVCRSFQSTWNHLTTTRGERRALMLTDVHYVLEVEGTSPITPCSGGKKAVHLGLPDCPGMVEWLEDDDRAACDFADSGRIDLGWMIYDTSRPHPRFFRAVMIDGEIAVAPQEATMLAS